MSIRPVVLNGMIQRTQDVGNLKQQEDNRPIVEQQNIQIEQQKHEDQLTHRVQDPEEKENDGYRYDAKEKGNNEYEGESGRHKKRREESCRKKKQENQKEDSQYFQHEKQSLRMREKSY